MEPTFEHYGDAMPEGRIKFLNSMGVVGKAVFVPTTDAMKQYTGIFQGALQGVLRLSLALDPSYNADIGIIPSIALKLLRDGHDSANLLGQEGFESNKTDWNFFSPFFSQTNELKETK